MTQLSDRRKSMTNAKKYLNRFSRNIGILSFNEQEKLSNVTVGIAGLGGLGGQTFINLVRMGVGKFNIADIDTFDIANTNRQIGATESSLGKSKVSVMSAMAKDINPDVQITEFPTGIQKNTVDEFVKLSDIIVDSLDFFCLTPRQLLYTHCQENRKTVILSAPLGFSATLHAFTENSMSPNQFFNWNDKMDNFDKMIHFAIGMAPAGLHLKYLNFDKNKVAASGTGPSISCACGLGAAMLSGEILIALLNRRKLLATPYYIQFDLYRTKYIKRRLFFGNRGLIQKFKIFIAKRHYSSVKNKLLEHIK